MHKVFASFLIVGLLITAMGCQKTPMENAVTSKNDGAFEAALEASPVLELEMLEEVQEATQETYVISDSFSSTDGSISYNLNVELQKENSTWPILQVTPHTFTSEEAEQLAAAIFGQAEMYEYSQALSKTQLEELILELKRFVSDWEGLVAYYDGDEVLAQAVTEKYQARIETYSQQYEQAPDTVEPVVCDWRAHPQSYYEDMSQIGVLAGDVESLDKTLYIKASTVMNGQPYVFSVANRDEQDFRLHMVSAYLNLPGATVSHYSNKEPSKAELEEVRAETERVLGALEEVGLGKWVIDTCEISATRNWADGGDDTVYHIYVVACPTYNDIKVTHQQQLMSVKSEDSYASDYYYEQITFDYSDGKLISFQYQSPLDVVDLVNEDVEIMTLEQSVDKLKTQLLLSTIKDPDPQSHYYNAERMEYVIDEVELGLVRTRIKNDEKDFYLVPAYTFRGSYEVYDTDGAAMDGNECVLVINAVDGSIINTQLGY